MIHKWVLELYLNHWFRGPLFFRIVWLSIGIIDSMWFNRWFNNLIGLNTCIHKPLIWLMFWLSQDSGLFSESIPESFPLGWHKNQHFGPERGWPPKSCIIQDRFGNNLPIEMTCIGWKKAAGFRRLTPWSGLLTTWPGLLATWPGLLTTWPGLLTTWPGLLTTWYDSRSHDRSCQRGLSWPVLKWTCGI